MISSALGILSIPEAVPEALEEIFPAAQSARMKLLAMDQHLLIVLSLLLKRFWEYFTGYLKS